MWGRELLLKGIRRRIGIGEARKVFKSPWLTRRSVTSQWEGGEEWRVCVLIGGIGCWNVALIKKLFWEVDADCILSTSAKLVCGIKLDSGQLEKGGGIELFSWKIFHNILPTSLNLNKRDILMLCHVGGVVQNFHGRLMLAFSKKIEMEMDVFFAETFSLLHGLKLDFDRCYINL
ncbi:hypothetical protein IC582_029347 [Cucumis melo]